EASRANGAKSRGPKTPEGKAQSARNAMRHGLLAGCIVIDGEDPEAFLALCAQYTDHFHPVNDVEMGFIEEMAAAYWRMRRGWAVERQLFEAALPPSGNIGVRVAGSWKATDAGQRFDLLSRYETRLQRIFQRAFNNLLKLRAQEKPSAPNEP